MQQGVVAQEVGYNKTPFTPTDNSKRSSVDPLLKSDQRTEVLQSQNFLAEPSEDKKRISRPLTSSEKARIKERYSEKAKERRLRMYEKAILLAEEREREEGKRYRLQRQLHFKVGYKTYVSKAPRRITPCRQFGQNVFVVGSAPPLGNWDAEKAVPLTWCPGDSWTGSATVSGDDGVVEYKYIIKDNSSGTITWEPGYNHKVACSGGADQDCVQIDASKLGATTIVDDAWGKHHAS